MENKYYLTNEQMDSFLEEIGGLENGFFPDRPKIQKAGFFAVGNGWYGIIKELIEKSIAAGWDKQICQVKEKFGGLRFYINSAPDGVHTLIREAENKSFEICEVCGNQGEPRKGGWIKTLCEEHHKNK